MSKHHRRGTWVAGHRLDRSMRTQLLVGGALFAASVAVVLTWGDVPGTMGWRPRVGQGPVVGSPLPSSLGMVAVAPSPSPKFPLGLLSPRPWPSALRPSPHPSLRAPAGLSLGPSPRVVASPTPKPSPRPVASPTPKPSPRPVASPTPKPSPRPVASPTPRPTPKASPRVVASPTAKPSPRPTPKPSPRVLASPSPAPKPSPRLVPSPTPKPSPRPVPSPTPKATPRPVPSPTPQPSPRLVASPSPAPRPSPRPVPSPTPQATPRPVPSPTVAVQAPSGLRLPSSGSPRTLAQRVAIATPRPSRRPTLHAAARPSAAPVADAAVRPGAWRLGPGGMPQRWGQASWRAWSGPRPARPWRQLVPAGGDLAFALSPDTQSLWLLKWPLGQVAAAAKVVGPVGAWSGRQASQAGLRHPTSFALSASRDRLWVAEAAGGLAQFHLATDRLERPTLNWGAGGAPKGALFLEAAQGRNSPLWEPSTGRRWSLDLASGQLKALPK